MIFIGVGVALGGDVFDVCTPQEGMGHWGKQTSSRPGQRSGLCRFDFTGLTYTLFPLGSFEQVDRPELQREWPALLEQLRERVTQHWVWLVPPTRHVLPHTDLSRTIQPMKSPRFAAVPQIAF